MRLDLYLSEQKKISRSLAGNKISKGKITINGLINKNKDYNVKEEDVIQEIYEEIPFKILYENDFYLIIFKPENYSVCRTFNTPKQEKVLNEEVQKIRTLSKAQKDHEFGLPHRLDKQTSGLMILTKTDYGYEKIISYFQNKQIRKKYIAFYELNNSFTINFENFKTFVCDHGVRNFTFLEDNFCLCEFYNNSKENCNDYKNLTIFHEEQKAKVVLKENLKNENLKNENLTNENSEVFMRTFVKQESGFFSCIPITGIRHQIRFSMKNLGYPIAGDSLYGGISNSSLLLYSVFLGIPDL